MSDEKTLSLGEAICAMERGEKVEHNGPNHKYGDWFPCNTRIYEFSYPRDRAVKFRLAPPPDPYAALKAAHKAGKVIEINRGGSFWERLRNEPSWNRPVEDYRIKPAPTYRPWQTMEEVPFDAWYSEVESIVRVRIVCAFGCGVVFQYNLSRVTMVTFKELHLRYKHSIDNGATWKPCGVEVAQ